MTILSSSPIFTFDLWFSRQLQAINTPLIDSYLKIVSFIGDYTPMMILLIATLIVFSFTKHKRLGQFLFFSTFVGIILSTILKLMVARARPSSELVLVQVNMTDFSFPSTHCVSYIIYFGFLYYFLGLQKGLTLSNKILKTILFLLIVSVSFSRVYLGAHWLSDCLAGYLLGYFVLLVTIKIYNNER